MKDKKKNAKIEDEREVDKEEVKRVQLSRDRETGQILFYFSIEMGKIS